MKVQFTARAERELERLARAWRELRPAAPELFLDELDEAKRHLQTAPRSGHVYGHLHGRPIRRWLLPRTQYHVYFSFIAAEQTLTIRSIWGARRLRGPKRTR